MTRAGRAFLGAAIVAVSAGLSAQAPEPQRQQPVFRASTSIVEVTVIVRDGEGRFVRDLTIEDFDVREAGAPQQIQTLYFVERPGSPAPAAADAPGVVAPAAPAMPAARRAFVFLFDMDQLSPAGLTRAREAVETFASSRLLPTDVSGVAAIGGASGRISSDHAATVQTAKALKPRGERVVREQALRQWPRILSPLEAMGIARGDERVLADVRDRACQERNTSCVDPQEESTASAGVGGGKQLVDESEVERNVIEAELRQKAQSYVNESRAAAARSVGALTQVATALERIPGRKTIVWLTEGTWPEEVARTATDAAHRASQSGVAVYTIDPRGLGRSMEGSLDSAAPADVGQALLQDQDDIANAMAEGSGGRAIRNENNLGRALSIIEDDTSTYYVLGYAPSDAGDRSTYRPLQVRVTRPGLEARVRHGFMAPQRVTEVTAPSPEPAPPVAPAPEPAAAAPALPAPEPAAAPHVPEEPVEPAVRTDAMARIGELAAGVDASGRDTGKEGLEAYQRGDLEAALPLLQQAASRPGAPAWVHYALGFSYVGLNKPRDAVASWERVLEAAPEFVPVYFDLATTYAQLKDFNSAMSVLRNAARRWPADREVHNAMGVVLTRRGDLDGAVDAFERAVTVTPTDPVSLLNVARAYELRYMRDRRWLAAQKRWVGNEEDRTQAKTYYERCAALGGPYGEQAKEALARLAWSDK